MKGVNMSISVNGQSQVPPGFRFHPTEQELLHYYLRKKVAYQEIDLDVIRDVDLNKLEPWDIHEKCKIGSTPQNDWYFFSHKDKKYPTGTRTNRATAAGFWKATGRDKAIYSNSRRIGMRKTLVFYRGRAPHGLKSDWIIHEYRLLDDNYNTIDVAIDASNTFCFGDTAVGDGQEEGGWVVCRIFQKKYHLKTAIDMNPFRVSSSRTINTGDETINTGDETINTTSQSLHSFTSTDQSAGTLDQILQQYMAAADPPPLPMLVPNHHCSFFNSSPSEPEFNNRSMKLPNLESPNNSSSSTDHLINPVVYQSENNSNNITDWAALDLLAARHLNGGRDDGGGSKHPPPQQLSYFGTDDATMGGFCCPSNQDLQLQVDESNRTFTLDDEECELWSFGRPSLSSGDPLSQLSNVHVTP